VKGNGATSYEPKGTPLAAEGNKAPEDALTRPT